MGLKHIFRCITCGAILKLEEALVYEINGETMPGEEEEEIVQETADEEAWTPEPEQEPEPEPEPEPVKEEKESANGQKYETRQGLFGPTPVGRRKGAQSKKEGKSEEKPKETKPAEPQVSKEEKGKLARKSLAERRKRKRSGGGDVRICKVCSSRLKPNERRCSKCGSPAY